MVRVDVSYDGDLRCTATHEPSGRTLITDAPLDNHGKGESFSPTDLLATSMLTCIITIIAIRAESRNINITGLGGNVEKIMGENPRRVGKLEINILLPDGISIKDKSWLIEQGCCCPVCLSIHEQVEVEVNFI